MFNSILKNFQNPLIVMNVITEKIIMKLKTDKTKGMDIKTFQTFLIT